MLAKISFDRFFNCRLFFWCGLNYFPFLGELNLTSIEIRDKIMEIFTEIFGGDALAAEYLLYHLISSV